MELCSTLYGSLEGREVWERMNTCICMTDSLHCSSESITTLLMSYTPIQNKQFFKNHLKGARRPEYFSKEDTGIANRHMKRC